MVFVFCQAGDHDLFLVVDFIEQSWAAQTVATDCLVSCLPLEIVYFPLQIASKQIQYWKIL